MDSALPGDSLLIEDDFNEFAAAVSEAADGSDDDPRSDDFLSWLLVHGETVDPKLELDQSEVATASKETNHVAGIDFNTPGDVSAEHPPHEHTEPRSSRPEQGEEVSMPKEACSAAISNPADSASASASPSEETIGGASEGSDSTGVGARRFLGELAVEGGIPSDPVLAMQMGARMALAGKLSLIPFGMTGGVGTGEASTRAQPPGYALESIAASTVSTPSGPTDTVSAAVETALPGWTGLPPPPKPWGKGEPEPFLTVPGRAENASGSSNTAEDLPAIDIEVNDVGAKVDTAGSIAFEDEDLSVGLGEKRPRTPWTPSVSVSVSPMEIKAGRDTFKDGRRRKRMNIGELEERVKQVSEDNSRLKLHLSSVGDKIKVMAGRKKTMEVEIAAKLEAQRSDPNSSNEASLAEVLSRFKDLYADYGAQRRREVQFHLKQLERQIVPTDTTKMSLWTLEQDESFYKDRKRGSLFNILRNELGVSKEQIDRIQERRVKIKGLLAELGESLRLVRELQKSSEAKNAKFEEVMARLQSSFSPQQIARLILWVSANRGRISKLPLLPKHIVEQRGLVKVMDEIDS